MDLIEGFRPRLTKQDGATLVVSRILDLLEQPSSRRKASP